MGQQFLPDAPSAIIRNEAIRSDLGTLQLSESCGVDKTYTQVSKKGARFWLRQAWQDQKQIYEAPFHRENLKWDFLFLLGTGGLIAADRHISKEVSLHGVNTSSAISDAGLYSTIAAVTGVEVFGLRNGDAHAREAGVLALESVANTAAVLALTQVAAGRERPTEGHGNGRFWQNNTLGSSFPSVHSGFTWAMASVMGDEYPRPLVQALFYGTATTVTATRVAALKHFPADVAVGGAFGFLIGRQIFNAHCSPGLRSKCHRNKKDK